MPKTIMIYLLFLVIFAIDSINSNHVYARDNNAQQITKQDNRTHLIISKVIDKYRINKQLEPFKQDPRLQNVANLLANDFYDHIIHKTPYPYQELREKYILQQGINLRWIEVNSLAISGGTKGLLKYLFDKHGDKMSGEQTMLFASRFIPTNQDPIPLNGFGAWIFMFAAFDGTSKGAVIDETLVHVNKFRAEHNLPPYKLDPALSFIADLRAKEMADQEWFAHIDPSTDESVKRHLVKYRYGSPRVLENLAFGQETPEGAVISWKNSKKGHREAMIDEQSILAGIGYRYNPDYKEHDDEDAGVISYPHIWVLLMSVAPDRHIYQTLLP